MKDSIIARRGKEAKNIAKVAAARELLTLVYYGLRDGRIRCLSLPAPAPAAWPTGAGGRAAPRQTVCPPPACGAGVPPD